MKKLILIFGIMLLLISCSREDSVTSSPLDFSETVQSTDLSLETGGLRTFHSSEQEIIEQQGEPLQRGVIGRNEILKGGEVVLEYKGYQYVLAKDKVVSYSLKSGQVTAKQVEIGDNASRIAELYGQNYYTREQDGSVIQGYLDKENDRVIEFILNQNKVMMVLVTELSLFK